MKRSVLLIAAGALGACGGRDPVADQANDTAGLPTLNEPAPSASGGPSGVATAPATKEATQAAAAAIPTPLHGRWGLTPQDCTSPAGAAEGLLTVTGGEMRFYESVAVPSGNVETAVDSISADFTFTGEGMTWTKFQTLQLQGDRLVRTESNPMASFTYVKCS